MVTPHPVATADTVTGTTAAVVLAGCRSVRFGSDKLEARLDGVPLLEHAVRELPADWELVIVGPQRPLPRLARFVREDPPDGGPGAGLVAGARAAAAVGSTMIATMPGDAPHGSAAVRRLAETLSAAPDSVVAVIGTDAAGVDQPLQLAARGPALRRLADRTDGHNIRARKLLDDLAATGDVVRLRLPPLLTADVDRPADLTALQDRLRQDRLRQDRT